MTAAWELVQQVPVGEVTIQAISDRSGISKPTIYRWWPSRNAVIIDSAFDRVAKEMTFDATTSAYAALRDQMRRVLALMCSRPGRVMAEILAEGQSDPATLTSFNEQFLQVRRSEVRELLERGIAAGEFAPDMDIEIGIDMIYGPLYFRLMAQHLPLSAQACDRLLEMTMSGLRPRDDNPPKGLG